GVVGEGIPVSNFLKANEIIAAEAKQANSQGKLVVVDGNFYHKEQIDQLVELLGKDIIVFTLKASVEGCIARDAARVKSYGEDAARVVHMFVSAFDYGTVIDTEEKTSEATMQAIMKNLQDKDASVYNNPKYYEIAFAFRDIRQEVNFIEDVIKLHSQVPVKTFLELASGNSPHMIELCHRGYRYVGIELDKEMIRFAEDKISEAHIPAKVVEADMRRFSLPEHVDCAAVFLGSLYVQNDEELISHLHSVASTLRSGGLYILDEVVEFFSEDVHQQTWDMQEGDIKITTTYAPYYLDEKSTVMTGKITLDVADGQKKFRLEHTEVKKVYSASDFIQQAERTNEWEFAGSYSDFDIHSDPKEKARNILVLRRK
ncbi:MAG: class I SAM-dependent methyltransferase, partial [Patescibacteria group bacterium]